MLLSHGRDEPVKKETDFTAERLGFFLIKLIFYLCTSELPNLCISVPTPFPTTPSPSENPCNSRDNFQATSPRFGTSPHPRKIAAGHLALPL